MISTSAPKRPRPLDHFHHDRKHEVIELSSDSEPESRPAKKKKSSTPNFEHQSNGILSKTAKPLTSDIAEQRFRGATPLQSRELSSYAPHLHVWDNPAGLKGNRDSSTTGTESSRSSSKATPRLQHVKDQGQPVRPAILHSRRSPGNDGGFISDSESSKARITLQNPLRASKEALSDQRLNQAVAQVQLDDDESLDEEVEILRHFRKPLPASRLPPTISQSLVYRQSPIPSSSQHRRPADAPPPQFRPNFTVEIPLAEDRAPAYLRSDYKEKRKALLEDIKSSKKPLYKSLENVEKYFGTTGFSESFAIPDEKPRLLKAAAKHHRQIDRAQVELDWGEPDIEPPEDSIFDLPSLIHPIEQVKQVLTTRFNESHEPPITFSNDLNDRRLNGKFQFVSSYIIGPGIKQADPRKDSGCSCTTICSPSTCPCLNTNPTSSSQYPPIPTYVTRNGITVLSPSFIANELDSKTGNTEIVECSDHCLCPPSCTNRVATLGRTLPLEIFQTPHTGFGVRSPRPILRGQFIELYLGEVLTQQSLEDREAAKEEGSTSYIFSLDFFKQAGQECYHIDGENFGSTMRFVNHSCNPNARSFTVVTQKNKRNLHYVAFFAIRDIRPGEEICIDYQNRGNVETISGDAALLSGEEKKMKEDAELDGDLVKCLCGAKNCRTWLWPLTVKKRRRRRKLLKP